MMMPQFKTKSNIKKGMTLMEVLLSIAILSVIMVSVQGALGSMFQSNNNSNRTLKLTSQAQQYLEQARGQLAANSNTFDNNTYDAPVSPLQVICTQYDATLNEDTKAPCSTGGIVPIKRLTVTVDNTDIQMNLDVARPNVASSTP